MTHPEQSIEQADHIDQLDHVDQKVLATRRKLIYGLNDKPPLANLLFIALQHVSVIFVPSVAPTILIGKALNLDAVTTSYLVGMTLFVAGIATFIQAKKIGPLGSGLLSIQGPSYAFLAPIFALIDEGNQAGHSPQQTLALILGLCFFGSFIPIILSRFIHLMQKIFTPLVTGTVVTLIGLTLIKIGLYQMAGGDAAKAAGDFGSLQYWGPSGLVFTIVVLCGATGNKYLRMGSVIIGLTAGFIVSALMGTTNFSNISSLPAFNVPTPFRFGLSFDLAIFITFILIYVAVTLEVTGDITATSMLTGEPIAGGSYVRRLKGGILADGVNSLIASVCSTLPVTTLAQNNGIIQLTGVGSRYVGYCVAAFLVFLGIFPVVGGVLMAVPQPVFGGAIMIMFATIAVAGFKILHEIELNNRSFMIIATALALGLGVTFYPESLAGFPKAIHGILESGVTVGALAALILNLILPEEKDDTSELPH